jgi:predicted transcriptional regulator
MAKLVLEFPDDINTLLDKLAEREGISKPEVIRRAIALYSYVHEEAVEKKRKLSITDKDDTILKDIEFD